MLILKMNNSIINQTNISDISRIHNSHSCYTALVWRLLLTKQQSYAIGISIGIVTIPTIICNIALYIGLTQTKQPNTVNNKYIKMTAIFGFLNGVTGQILYVILFIVYPNMRCCILEMAGMFVNQFNTHMLAYIIFMLAIHRYFSVRPNLRWYTRMTQWMLSTIGSNTLIAIAIIFSAIHALSSTYFFASTRAATISFLMLILNGILAIAIYVAYFRLYFQLEAHAKNTSSIQSTNRNAAGRPKYLREFIKTIAIILIAGFLCYLPFIILDFWTGWYTFVKETVTPRDIRFAYYISVTPVFLNSPINSALLLFRNVKAFAYVKNIGKLMHHNELQHLSPSSRPKHSNDVIHHDNTIM